MNVIRKEFKQSDLCERLRTRADIRRQIPTRKSVQEGKRDRIADLLEEAAIALEDQQAIIDKWNEQFGSSTEPKFWRILNNG